jgi:hypothetical protein
MGRQLLNVLIVWLAVLFFFPIPHVLAFDGNGDLVGVAEPGTLFLFASGLAGVVGAAWRRHRRK